MIDFNHSRLFISLRSPFARRVRLAFNEHGINFKEEVVDVFKPTPELTLRNPLSRVPTLEFSDERVLVDSNIILQAFYDSSYKSSPLLLQDDDDKLEALKWSGIGTGVCDKLVEFYLETLRFEEKRDQEVLDECHRGFENFLLSLESALCDKKFIAGAKLTQADLDLGTALAYMSLRYSDSWQLKYKNTNRYFQALNERPSFQKTRPPQ
jgi:glutathione S-transferase